MTLSPSAALSILIPINLDNNKDITPGSPDSICSVDIQSDDENDRQVAEKRLSRYFPETPVSIGAIIKPQFSCPDFAMGTARGMKGRMKETPPAIPSIPSIHLRKQEERVETSPTVDNTSPSPRQRVRPMNSFVNLDSVKRGWEDTFGEEKMAPRKRHGMFFGRLQRLNLEPPNPHPRESRFLTSFDELFKPELPSSQRYPFREERENHDEELRNQIRQGMEDSIIPSVQATPVKSERVPLKERIRGLINSERPKRRRTGWLEKIVGKKRLQGKVHVPKEYAPPPYCFDDDSRIPELEDGICEEIDSPFGSVTKKDIENEVKAITDICASSGHGNVIRFLDHGPLPASDYYYIDMELCDFNLDKYIHAPNRLPLIWGRRLKRKTRERLKPAFCEEWNSIQEKRENVWTIMDHITTGVEFLHGRGLAHRDLKPQNVLYRYEENKWVIADFGITSHATTDQAVPTYNARGTGGYRAPELLTTPPAFTKKVDIWALGCILYELLTQQKAFADDWKVRDYDMTASIKLEIRGDPDFQESSEHETSLMSLLLDRDPLQRPRVSDLRPLLQSYGIVWCDPVWDIISRLGRTTNYEAKFRTVRSRSIFPPFSQWVSIVKEPFSRGVLVMRLSEWYEGRRQLNTAIELSIMLVSEYPQADEYRQRLEYLYKIRDEPMLAIAGWTSLVERHPGNTKFHKLLTDVCRAWKGLSYAVSVWTGIVKRHPANMQLILVYAQLAAEACLESGVAEDIKRAVNIWGALVENYPRVTRLHGQLKTALKSAGGGTHRGPHVWRELVRKHPQEKELIFELRMACEEMDEVEETVEIWVDLVKEHPDVPELQSELSHALRWSGDSKGAVDTWEELRKRYPENKGLEREWEQACEAQREEGNSIEEWRRILRL